MPDPSGGVPLEALSFAISAGCLVVWTMMLAGRSLARLSARGMFALTGYLRPRPDPWLEHMLRDALAEFDRELRRIVPRLYGHDNGES